MCGIIAAFDTSLAKKEVNTLIVNQYQDQKNRGSEGFGIIKIYPNSFTVERATEPCKFLLDLYMEKASMIIAHHRYPTSTPNKLSQTHPMFISNALLEFDYLVVHNGVIHNDEEIKKEHEKIGFKYQTEIEKYSTYGFNTSTPPTIGFNDSEAMATEMALFIEGKTKEVRTRGSQAFVILQINKKTQRPTNVFFGQKGNPLKMYQEQTHLFLSSEGKGEMIKEKTLFSFNIKDKNMKLETRDIIFTPEAPSNYDNDDDGSSYRTNYEYSDKTKSIICSDMEEYYKESIKDKDSEEIDEMEREAIESVELEIMEIVSEMISELQSSELEAKTGTYKKNICLKLDEIKRIMTYSQAEMAVALQKESKEEQITNIDEQEFLKWRHPNKYVSKEKFVSTRNKESLGKKKLAQLGF